MPFLIPLCQSTSKTLPLKGSEVPVFGCRDYLTVEVGRVADAIA